MEPSRCPFSRKLGSGMVPSAQAEFSWGSPSDASRATELNFVTSDTDVSSVESSSNRTLLLVSGEPRLAVGGGGGGCKACEQRGYPTCTVTWWPRPTISGHDNTDQDIIENLLDYPMADAFLTGILLCRRFSMQEIIRMHNVYWGLICWINETY